MGSRYSAGGDNQNNGWIGPMFIIYIIMCLLFVVFMCWVTSCSPRIVEKVVTEIEYRDRVVHDTATVEITKEVEKIVTKDTVSHLENKYAKSDAMVSKGLLHHSLESRPQIIKVPVEVHVTDTIWKQTEAKETIKEVKVEQPLSWWNKTKLEAFWGLLLAVVLLLLWTLRKPLMKLVSLI